jgi:hypothetical protein
VDAGGIERIVAIADAQEAGALLERLGAKPRHLQSAFARAERAVGVSVHHDVLRQPRSDARDARQSSAEAVLRSTPTAFTQSSTTASSEARRSR